MKPEIIPAVLDDDGDIETPMKVKLLLVAEIDIWPKDQEGQIPDKVKPDSDPVELARLKLDYFREAVQPSYQYGICLYQAGPDEQS